MTVLDWVVLATALAGMVAYGVWRGGSSRTITSYFLANREMRGLGIALSIMATQASAITFLSTPGQAYADGMRFVQFYLGLPIAMIVLCATAVPLFHRLNVVTAYELLERRFDLKTRALAAFLFLLQRGLAAGLTIFAPALILSVMLGWDLTVTNLLIGVAVVVYTTSGGTRGVNRTHLLQMAIILLGMAAAFVVLLLRLPDGVGLLDALRVAGSAGKLNAIELSFDPSDRYTLWTGLVGGFFLAMSYFGTDQSQVQRYLTGRSVAESRMGLLVNGVVKVPMQFAVLLLGALVFAFYQLSPPPLFFNPVVVQDVLESPSGPEFRTLEADHRAAAENQRREILRWLDDRDAASADRVAGARAKVSELRSEGVALIRQAVPDANPDDVNYIFLSFVFAALPAGLVGLVLAMAFAASMSSTASELNALASTTVVDVYQRLLRRTAPDRHYVLISRLVTVFWGVFAVSFAEYAARLGSLVEAVNILGSLFYGTILGIFLLAFSRSRVAGTAVFAAALAAEAVVIALFAFSEVGFLWYNVIGCGVTVSLALAIGRVVPTPSAAS